MWTRTSATLLSGQMEYVRYGEALGTIRGPPCESWPAAKWSGLKETAGPGPPTLWATPDVDEACAT
eukprot:7031409-Pyramimonas_sp.AAC.1